MAWAKTNLSVNDDLDSILFIPGLCSVLKNIKSDSFVLLNVCVNGLKRDTLPENYNTYVLGFWHEVFDDDWFHTVYNKHKNAEFIIMGDFHPNDLEKLERVKFVRLLHWNHWVKFSHHQPIDWNVKKFKISSLSNYITEFRFFVTAALLDKKDVVFSWHNQQRSFGNFDYILKKTGYPLRDKLLENKSRLQETFEIDNFNFNDPERSIKKSIGDTAYKNSLINCMNETKDVSWTENLGYSPGPYLTEKTWKPLLNGNAFIFSGQFGVKNILEQAGFVFDYPWNSAYSDIPGDLERLEKIIETIEIIDSMNFEDIKTYIMQSCEHNIKHFISNDYINYIKNINIAGLEKLTELVK